MISPSRGLFVYVPVAVVPIYLLIRHWRDLPHRPLAAMGAAIVVTNVLIVASWLSWWGGYSIGPRLLTDTIPWFVMIAILGWKGRENCYLRAPSGKAPRTVDRMFTAVAVLLAVFSVAINGWGATSQQPLRWNKRVDVYAHPECLWDWRSPQFLAGLMPAGNPASVRCH